MAKCDFTLPFQGDPQAGFAAAKREILRQGGKVVGDADSGHASMPTPVGSIALAYELQGNQLAIQVTDKPFLVSCAQIRDGLAKALAQAPKIKPKSQPAQPVQPTPTPTRPQGGKVTVLDTQYIEGEVPHANPLWYWVAGIGAFLVVGGTIYWLKRR